MSRRRSQLTGWNDPTRRLYLLRKRVLRLASTTPRLLAICIAGNSGAVPYIAAPRQLISRSELAQATSFASTGTGTCRHNEHTVQTNEGGTSSAPGPQSAAGVTPVATVPCLLDAAQLNPGYGLTGIARGWRGRFVVPTPRAASAAARETRSPGRRIRRHGPPDSARTQRPMTSSSAVGRRMRSRQRGNQRSQARSKIWWGYITTVLSAWWPMVRNYALDRRIGRGASPRSLSSRLRPRSRAASATWRLLITQTCSVAWSYVLSQSSQWGGILDWVGAATSSECLASDST